MGGWHHQLNGHAAAAAKSLQSCPTLSNPIDSSPLGSLIPGILQARTLEWVAIAFSAMDMSLYKLWELVMNMMPGLLQSMAQSIGLQRVGHD